MYAIYVYQVKVRILAYYNIFLYLILSEILNYSLCINNTSNTYIACIPLSNGGCGTHENDLNSLLYIYTIVKKHVTLAKKYFIINNTHTRLITNTRPLKTNQTEVKKIRHCNIIQNEFLHSSIHTICSCTLPTETKHILHKYTLAMLPLVYFINPLNG